jgi:hypothetical protein
MVHNAELKKLDTLVGEWSVTMSDAWFLEPPGTEVPGTATIEWLGESFLVWRTQLAGDKHAHSQMTWVLGRSDANNRFVALYHDDRGVCRQFDMTFDGGHWTMTREDPDFHQRIIADVEDDRILGRAEASDDQGRTWRKDFNLTFSRV